jgi:hypothetical protein
MRRSQKKRFHWRSSFFVGVLICSALLISCSKNPNGNTIIGKWRVQSQFSETVEFREGGIIVSSRGTNTLSGKYRFVDNNHIKIEFDAVVDHTNTPLIVNCEIQIRGNLIDMTTGAIEKPGQAALMRTRNPVITHLQRIEQ